jgi:hypothetical protein
MKSTCSGEKVFRPPHPALSETAQEAYHISMEAILIARTIWLETTVTREHLLVKSCCHTLQHSKNG